MLSSPFDAFASFSEQFQTLAFLRPLWGWAKNRVCFDNNFSIFFSSSPNSLWDIIGLSALSFFICQHLRGAKRCSFQCGCAYSRLTVHNRVEVIVAKQDWLTNRLTLTGIDRPFFVLFSPMSNTAGGSFNFRWWWTMLTQNGDDAPKWLEMCRWV